MMSVLLALSLLRTKHKVPPAYRASRDRRDDELYRSEIMQNLISVPFEISKLIQVHVPAAQDDRNFCPCRGFDQTVE